MKRPSICLAIAIGLSLPSRAGDIVHSGGVLGSSVSYELTGNPGILFAFIPSLNNGPLPLALLDPGDPRLLDVGLDLQALWVINAYNTVGSFSISYPLPSAPALHGLKLHAQSVEILLTPNFFGDVSSLSTLTLGLPGQSAVAAGSTVENRVGQTMTVLDDGRILIAAGGAYPTGGASFLTDTLELWDAQLEGSVALNATTSTPRVTHAAVKLLDGSVLIIGGADSTAFGVDSVDRFDPATETVSPVAPMLQTRALPSAVLLADGRVFVSGGVGVYDPTDLTTSIGTARDTTELYDPSTNAWTPGPTLPKPRALHAASRLHDGRVLLTGGAESTVVFGVTIPTISNDCRIFDPTTSTLSGTAAFDGRTALHGQITLGDGRVLIAGGTDVDVATFNFSPLVQTRLYNPSTATWTNTPDLDDSRAYVSLIDTGDHIFVVGGVKGVDVTTTAFTPALAIESAPYSLLTWTRHADLQIGREIATSALIAGESKIVTVGAGAPADSGPAYTSELFFLP